MEKQRIHQFSFATSAASGVTNGIFYAQKMLREMGFESEIYSSSIPEYFSDRIFDPSALRGDPDALILVHHCLGYDHTEWLWELPNPKVMVYHNITPPELLPPNSEIAEYAKLGRVQLAQWRDHFIGAIGDSTLNSSELAQHNYAQVETIPLLLDFDKHLDRSRLQQAAQRWHVLADSYNLLFVGRICENKNQAELIEVLAHLRYHVGDKVRLVLAGDVTSSDYAAHIQSEIQRWSLQNHVLVTGKLDEEELASLYQHADAFLCLSRHEGFGMPLIEAMHFGLPVLAKSGSSVDATMGGAGWLFSENESLHGIAFSIASLMREPALRRQLLRSQKERLKAFSKSNIKQRLANYLQRFGFHAQNLDETVAVSGDAQPLWQVEGPFDSSYSLAIVNREMARALHRQQVQVALRSHEGLGDFEPNPQFLQQESDVRELYQRSQHQGQRNSSNYPDIALRFCYPPLANHMPAGMRVMHSYGWEESGFPLEYVEEFNRRLDLVTVLSQEVKKILRDNGVRIPIAVTGAGIDQHNRIVSADLPQNIRARLRGFNFLHISSCFPRKGVDVLLRAYGRSFSTKDDVTLIIKTFPNPHNKVEQLLQAYRIERADFPDVLVINEDWSDAELTALYGVAQAFVAPSRGEGFGLPLAEAMMHRLPVVTTRWGGQSDFCTDQTAWLCDYEFARAETHLGLTHSLWAEPDELQLAAHLKELFSISDEQKLARIDAAQALVASRFTWDESARKLMRAVRAVQQQSSLRSEPKIAWLSTWNARCGIANYSHALSRSIPNQRLLVLANHIPERTALDGTNVIRCWNAEQEERFDYACDHMYEHGVAAAIIQYNFGFCSVENLGRLLDSLSMKGIASYVFFHSTADANIFGNMVSLSSIRESLRKATRLIVHGIKDMNRMKAWGLQDNSLYFPHGLDLVSEQQRAHFRKHPKFDHCKVVASYGFLLPHKGLPELIEAFAQLDHASASYHLLMVNALYPNPVSNQELIRCQEAIREHGLHDKVTMVTEYLSDTETQALLLNADVIAFPYQETQESSSAAVRTGLATGRPVMVTPLSIFDDVKEAVDYFAGTDSESIARSLRQLFAADGSIAPLTEEQRTPRERWFQERNWGHLSQRLLNLIDGEANDLQAS